MVGYLDKKSNNWFKSWTEKFCVLTNVGLLYYDDPTKRPRNLFPCITAQVDKVSDNVHNRKLCFKLVAFNQTIIFAAKTETDFEGWRKGFIKLREDSEKKRVDIMSDKGVTSKKSAGQTEERDGATVIGRK